MSQATLTQSPEDSLLLKVLRGTPTARPPIWLMRQAGRYLPEYQAVRAEAGDFLSLCFTPELAAEVTLQPIRRFGFDAAILFSDILTVPWALDRGVRFVAGEGPRLDPLDDLSRLPDMSPDRVVDRLAPVYQAAERTRAALPDDVPLIGFAGAPWTVACYMIEGSGSRDFAVARKAAYADPTGFRALIEGLAAITAHHLAAQIRAGAAVVQVFDSWAGVLAPQQFRDWVIGPTAQIVARLRGLVGDDVPIIGFPRGGGAMIPAYVAETGVDAVGLDTTVDPAWAARTFGADVPLQGNLDPMALVAGGAVLDRAVESILQSLEGRAHVFNLGHGVVPETPIDHVLQLIDRVRTGT